MNDSQTPIETYEELTSEKNSILSGDIHLIKEGFTIISEMIDEILEQIDTTKKWMNVYTYRMYQSTLKDIQEKNNRLKEIIGK